MKKNKVPSYTRLSLRRIRRTIIKSPVQFIAMLVILAIGTTLFTGLYASSLAFNKQIDTYYEQSNMADVWTTVYNDFDEHTKEHVIEDFNTVKDAVKPYDGLVEGRYYQSVRINENASFVCLSDNYPTINHPAWTNTTDKENFLILDARFGDWDLTADFPVTLTNAKLHEKIKGETIAILNSHLKTGKENIFDSDEIMLKGKPTGIMLHAENAIRNRTQPSIFLLSRSYATSMLNKLIEDTYDKNAFSDVEKEKCKFLFEPENEIVNYYWANNQYVTKLAKRSDASLAKNAIYDAFTDRSNRDNNIIVNNDLINLSSNIQLENDRIQSVQFCYVYPPIFFAVALLVVLTTFGQIISRERKEIGMQKAIGVSTGRILFYYVGLAVVISLIGVIIGLVVGPLTLPAVMGLRYNVVYRIPARQFVFPTVAGIIMSLVVLLVVGLVAFCVAYREARIPPVMSLRPKALKQKKLRAVANAKQTSSYRLSWRMALRNVRYNIPRSIMVIIGVLGCTALFGCAFAIEDTVNYSINSDLHIFFDVDAMSFLNNQSQDTIDKFQEMYDNHELTGVEPYAYLPAVFQKSMVLDRTYSSYVYSLPPNYQSYFDLSNKKIKNNQVIVSSIIAKNLNIHVGDLIRFQTLNFECAGEVVDIVDTFFMHGVFVDGSYVGYPHYLKYCNNVLARYNPDLDRNELTNKIKGIKGVSDVYEKERFVKEQIHDVVSNVILTLVTVIKLFAASLALVVIYNLALLNFNDNRHRIAIMKTLGFNRREIAATLFFEITILSLIGIAIGLALAYPLAILTFSVNVMPGLYYIYALAPASLVITFACTFAVSVIVNLYYSHKNKQIKMIEALKSIE